MFHHFNSGDIYSNFLLSRLKNQIPLKSVLMGMVVRAYEASQTTVLHMKRFNKTESLICSLFPEATF